MTGLQITLHEARRMTMPEATRLFGYWRKNPPIHEIGAMFARVFTTWAPDRSLDELREDGAMGPEDFFRHFQRTGGKVEGLGRVGM